ncbi:MAG TPA: hypothetical protein VKY41_10510 [Xanthomarina sp.]|nr:hypothetical protein [Xanthomarina sp.]
MIIQHALVNWDLENLNPIFKKSKTLVLGSFNPNKPDPNQITDFYYGRTTNHFWKSIARNMNLPENHFTNNLQDKIVCMNKYRFFCCDIINSIELECANEEVLNQYVNERIYTKYEDKELFRVRRPFNFNNQLFYKTLEFNHQIIELLEQNNITKVIHTLGNRRIENNLIARPLNINLGFNPFVTQIINTCNNNEIEFVSTSYSPSQTAVNRGGQDYRDNLDNWINQHILCLKKSLRN